jgi:hypothetical protein
MDGSLICPGGLCGRTDVSAGFDGSEATYSLRERACSSPMAETTVMMS